MTASFVWKLLPAAALVAAILIGAFARAPRHPIPRMDLRALVMGALLLYGVGLVALLSHRPTLAGLLYGTGITASTLAGWLSRGSSDGRPPGRDDPAEPDPPDPRGIDWEALERQLQTSSRPRDPLLPSSGR